MASSAYIYCSKSERHFSVISACCILRTHHCIFLLCHQCLLRPSNTPLYFSSLSSVLAASFEHSTVFFFSVIRACCILRTLHCIFLLCHQCLLHPSNTPLYFSSLSSVLAASFEHSTVFFFSVIRACCILRTLHCIFLLCHPCLLHPSNTPLYFSSLAWQSIKRLPLG